MWTSFKVISSTLNYSSVFPVHWPPCPLDLLLFLLPLVTDSPSFSPPITIPPRQLTQICSTLSWPGSDLTPSEKTLLFCYGPIVSPWSPLYYISSSNILHLSSVLSQWLFSLIRRKFLKKLLHFLEFLFHRRHLNICNLLYWKTSSKGKVTFR